MLKELSDNINMLMAKARITSSELAKETGVPATTIKRLRNNENANPTITTLLPLAEYFSISLNQLIGQEALKHSLKKTDEANLTKLPLFSLQDCIHYDGSNNLEKFPKQIFTERNVSKKAFALLIEDYDLEIFPRNSLLIVDPEKTPETGDYIIVGNTQQNITSIRKFIIEIDQTYLKPLVAGVETTVFSTEYKILGVILQYKVEIKR